MTGPDDVDPRMVPAVDLLRRTGAGEFRLGYSHEDDGPPTVWHATATFPDGNAEAAAGTEEQGADIAAAAAAAASCGPFMRTGAG